jgi:predicted Zn finger-like uncharacterized protein
MKIVCPQCRTAYDVTPASLGQEGRQVRCARCQAVWYAELSRPDADAPDASGDRVEPSFEAETSDLPSPADAGPDWPQPDAPDAEIPMPEASDEFATPPGQLPMAAAPADDTSTPGRAETPPSIEATDRPAAKSKAAAAASSADVESIVARPRKQRPPKLQPWHARGLTAAIIVLAVVDAAVIAMRADIVRALPQTASLFNAIGLGVNLRHLTFKDITTKQEKHEGATILVVEGTIVATGSKPTEVPRLRFAISAGNGHEIYAWTALPSRTKLAPGEALPFRTRLASPPEQGQSIKIRFFNRRDIGAGLS